MIGAIGRGAIQLDAVPCVAGDHISRPCDCSADGSVPCRCVGRNHLSCCHSDAIWNGRCPRVIRADIVSLDSDVAGGVTHEDAIACTGDHITCRGRSSTDDIVLNVLLEADAVTGGGKALGSGNVNAEVVALQQTTGRMAAVVLVVDVHVVAVAGDDVSSTRKRATDGV